MTRSLARVIAVLVVVGVAVTGANAAAAKTKPSTIGFRPVLAQVPAATATSSTAAPGDRAAAGVTVAKCDVAAVLQLPVIPTTNWRTASADQCVVYPNLHASEASRFYLGPASTLPIRTATPQFVPGQGWTVKLELTKAGSRAWDQLAEQQFHQQVAMTYRGKVVSAPTIEPEEQTFRSFDGIAVVSGAFSKKEAVALAAAARANGR